MKQYPSLKEAIARDDFKIELIYENGEKKMYDFKDNLEHPFYQALKDVKLFSKVHVIQGELVWESGQDFCPNTLYEKSAKIN